VKWGKPAQEDTALDVTRVCDRAVLAVQQDEWMVRLVFISVPASAVTKLNLPSRVKEFSYT
jgi:hypothetical protein